MRIKINSVCAFPGNRLNKSGSQKKSDRAGRDKIMKTSRGEKRISRHWKWLPACTLIIAGFLFALPPAVHAQISPGGGCPNDQFMRLI
jgi:hypothetical protein